MSAKKSKKKKTGLGFMVWAIGLIIILIIFLVKKDDIFANLKSTNAFERLGLETPEFIEKHEKEPQPDSKETVITLHTQDKKKPQKPAPEEKKTGSSPQAAPALPPPPSGTPGHRPASPRPAEPQTAAAPRPQQPPEPADSSRPVTDMQGSKERAAPERALAESREKLSAQEEKLAAQNAAGRQAAESKPAKQESAPKAAASTNAKLYFVVIENDGAVSRKQITRTISKSDSPLSENIRQLLAGPNQAERAKGCISLVPEGTRLLSASVSNGVAMLNFSEAFEYNRVGVEGYLGQLMQIVYTATEFPTVSSVQILIDGQKREYLGSEGVWIGSPLSRSSF